MSIVLGQGRESSDDPEDGDALRQGDLLDPRNPAPEPNEPDYEDEPDDGQEIGIPDRELDPDQEDPNSTSRE